MSSDKRGMRKGLTRYGDEGFALYLRKSFIKAMGYTDDGGGDLFIDDDASVFEGDIDKLATAGVTAGCNPPANTNYCPDSYVTRGQLAAFLHRALG